MSSEEAKLQREEIPVPLYFDRYVAGELRSLGNRITQVDSSLSNRIAQVDRRINELKESMDERFVQVDRRFTELKESMDERFVQVDRRSVDLKGSVDKLFDKSDATLKWVIGLFSPVIIGILAIIIKMFFGP
jgi:hypothetical protein